jgi:hypothetical protein
MIENLYFPSIVKLMDAIDTNGYSLVGVYKMPVPKLYYDNHWKFIKLIEEKYSMLTNTTIYNTVRYATAIKYNEEDNKEDTEEDSAKNRIFLNNVVNVDNNQFCSYIVIHDMPKNQKLSVYKLSNYDKDFEFYYKLLA